MKVKFKHKDSQLVKLNTLFTFASMKMNSECVCMNAKFAL